MLMLTRNKGQSIKLHLEKGADTVEIIDLLMNEGITIHVSDFEREKIKIGIDAPKSIKILRTELVDKSIS